ncbi:MAG TPA: non-homologous end-joining DNA ligase [Candidatus Sulfotelmatobacter sp.]|nr:non-homologous end-joining DNA ligase [Candidatus Sulfotelmatobacter sp.]
MRSLTEYARKRNFKKTSEPPPASPISKSASRPNEKNRGLRSRSRFTPFFSDSGIAEPSRGTHNRFVIQKHAATRLHYDFRLEIDGVLKSWAVPKGIPFAKGEKRLAVQVEDHPVSYIHFEGGIPKGQYGGGTVMVWDKGTFSTDAKTPAQDLESGKLHFTLKGKKLQGEWYLVRLRDSSSNQWLLIKGGEDMKPVSKKSDDTSALSGKTMQQLSQNGAVWESKQSLDHSPRRSSSNMAPERLVGHDVPVVTARATGACESPLSRDRDQSAYARAHKTKLAPAAFIEPMKARLVSSPPAYGDWIYEIKFDGYRAMAFKNGNAVRLFSRTEKDFGEKFPEIVDALALLKANEAIIDGEIVALDSKGVSSFQLLQAIEIGERPPLYYYAFDLLRLNGKDLRKLPLIERKAQLEQILKNAPPEIRCSASLGDDAGKLLKQVAELGLEGLIGKRTDSVYEPGKRSSAWIKLKTRREQEFVIGGYTNPKGARAHFGALLVGFYEGKQLKFCGKVGTGFNTKLLNSLHTRLEASQRDDCPFANLPELRGSRYSPRITAGEMKKCHWVEPELVCQIAFSEWTRDNKLRQPAFLGLREDKEPREVIREKPEW